jgi:hypothetical protein
MLLLVFVFTAIDLSRSDAFYLCLKTVTPAQPANFLFYLDSNDGPGWFIVETVVESGLTHL